jgi:hypothetical protein
MKKKIFFRHSAQYAAAAVRHIFLPSLHPFELPFSLCIWSSYITQQNTRFFFFSERAHKKKYCAVWHLQHAFVVKLKNFSLQIIARSLVYSLLNFMFNVCLFYFSFFHSLPFHIVVIDSVVVGFFLGGKKWSIDYKFQFSLFVFVVVLSAGVQKKNCRFFG